MAIEAPSAPLPLQDSAANVLSETLLLLHYLEVEVTPYHAVNAISRLPDGTDLRPILYLPPSSCFDAAVAHALKQMRNETLEELLSLEFPARENYDLLRLACDQVMPHLSLAWVRDSTQADLCAGSLVVLVPGYTIPIRLGSQALPCLSSCPGLARSAPVLQRSGRKPLLCGVPQSVCKHCARTRPANPVLRWTIQTNNLVNQNVQSAFKSLQAHHHIPCRSRTSLVNSINLGRGQVEVDVHR